MTSRQHTLAMRFRWIMSRHVVFTIATAISLLVMVGQIGETTGSGSGESRARAWDVLRSRVHERDYLNHSLGVEAIMRELAVRNTDEVDQWALAGLLHDIDITTTERNLSRHGIEGAQILDDLGFSQGVVHAVKAHDDHAGIARKSRLDHALYCADQLYWLIVDIGLSCPSDKLKNVMPESVLKQVQAMPGKATVLRKTSDECAQIGLTMPEAFESALRACRGSVRRPISP
jgi:putative nucleotidyltransferase with HDIG domain